MACVKKSCAPAISAGDMDTPVTLQRMTLAPDGKGGQVKTWADVGVIYFSVAVLNGREVYVDEQLRGEADHAFLTRWSTASYYRIAIEDRLVMDNDVTPSKPFIFNIRAVENMEYSYTVARILAERGVPT
jgi:SPP1 family predicted phage head-tail adaptor